MKEHNYDHDIDFTYKGKTSSILVQFKDRHIANVRAALGDTAPYTGFAMLHTTIAQGSPPDSADNRFLSCKLGRVVFTRLDKESGLNAKDKDRLKKAVTRTLKNKLNGRVYPMGIREGVVFFYRIPPWPRYYLPTLFVLPCDFEDLKNWLENGFGPAKRL